MQPPAKANPTETARTLGFTRLLAGGSGIAATLGIALVLLAALALALDFTLNKESWAYQFFFKRSFVQWVLLGSFLVGLIHVAQRVPEWLREARALRTLADTGGVRGMSTLVERRWIRLQHAQAGGATRGLPELARNLAEHDDAEMDAAYRLSTDIVQMLPLIGFFGTVFGLSHGLYQSFLAAGGATTKEFAKAIAVAFDNTLLGLALTILLFTAQSLLRKREEALLLRLNLLTSFTPDGSPDGAAGGESDPA